MNGNTARAGRTAEVRLVQYERGVARAAFDEVVTEEPLEIRIAAGGTRSTLAVTMRTPGNDFELAAGFVASEGLVFSRDDIDSIEYCVDPEIGEEQRYNIVTIELRGTHLPDLDRFERHFTMNSSCGVCGRANIEALAQTGLAPLEDEFRLPIDRLYALPEAMRAAQRVFASTGGLHAAALFEASGETIAIREDIGRHNAVDKIVGWATLNGRVPLDRTVMIVSGRASYEIVQKAATARIPIVCAVSAPSTLAVDLARAFNVTLVGFLRGTRANVYSASERLTSNS